jgi:hypothetical protein
LTGSDLFQIETVKAYPADYTETTKVSQDELNQSARPELTETVAGMDSYDVIYLGYQSRTLYPDNRSSHRYGINSAQYNQLCPDPIIAVTR